MPDTRKDRNGVFISYARSDGEAFAHRLRQQLEEQPEDRKIKAWMDRIGLEGGRDWWSQIKEALNKAEFLALVVTPNALKSENVRREWQYARQQGVCVYPIEAAPDLNFDDLPRWMREAHRYNLGTLEGDQPGPNWQRFLNDLNTTPQVRRVPFMVEDLPTGFVQRPHEFDQLIALLLNEKRDEPVAITAALRGAGGYGKTTIAKALCHDERIQEAFDDGILWVTLGENPGDPTGRVEDLIQTLSGERPGFSNTEAAIARLKELLADRDLLIVIDDVWNRDHLRPFMQGGPRSARLITTRNPHTLPARAAEVTVDAMRAAEAVALLSSELESHDAGDPVRSPGFSRNDSPATPLPPEGGTTNMMAALAARLGEWPLLLKLANGVLRHRVKAGDTLPAAIVYANRALDKRGLKAFDDRNPVERNQAAELTLRVSLDQLSAADRGRFSQLAIFPEDVPLPLPTLEKYWGLDDLDTEELCDRLHQCSLLHSFDLGARTIRLHDVIRWFLRYERKADLAAFNNQLLDTNRPAAGWAEMQNDEPYLWDHLANHLIEAGRGEELVAAVKDWRYLAKKTWLRKSHAVENDLLKAEETAPTDGVLRTLRRNFASTGHLFNRCATRKEINETLFVRLQHLDELQAVLQGVAQSLETPYIVPFHRLPELPHPTLSRTLEGHSGEVWRCVFSPDGKLIVSASYDSTLKVWDTYTGKMLRTLKGHSKEVNGCACSPDGKLLVSASNDGTLKIWDITTGEILRTLAAGNLAPVSSCAFSPDGKLIISASGDLKIWDAQLGEILCTLKGDSSSVDECAFSPDGKMIVSACFEGWLEVWDAQSGELLRMLKGHSASVYGCAFSPDGKLIVSASEDCTLKVWDTHTGKMLRTLKGHSNPVGSCAFSPDGKLIVSASWDNTLKVWDMQSGKVLRTLAGYPEHVLDCAFSPDGNLIISASGSGLVEIWETHLGEMLHTPKEHSSFVNDLAFSPDGKDVASASNDRTLKVWDARSGEILRTLKRHSLSVNGCAFSPDGKLIVSASDDSTLKVWHVQLGKVLHTLKGHSFSVNGCAFSPDGKLIVSASSDHTLKVWDALSGTMLRTLNGHSAPVYDCAFSPDGKLIISASSDGEMEAYISTLTTGVDVVGTTTIEAEKSLLRTSNLQSRVDINALKVWDAQSGEILRTLEGHSASINGCTFSPDGRLIVSASHDHTLKVWDVVTGQMLRTLKGHLSYVLGCVFSSDGMLLISTSSDGTLKVWEARLGQCLATFFADGPLRCCAIYGEMIVAGGARGLYFLRLVR